MGSFFRSSSSRWMFGNNNWSQTSDQEQDLLDIYFLWSNDVYVFP